MQLGVKRTFSQITKEEEKIKRRKINATTFEEIITKVNKDKNSNLLKSNCSKINLPSIKRENSCRSTLSFNSKFSNNFENKNCELKRAFSYSNLHTHLRQNFKRTFGDITNLQNVTIGSNINNNFIPKIQIKEYLTPKFKEDLKQTSQHADYHTELIQNRFLNVKINKTSLNILNNKLII